MFEKFLSGNLESFKQRYEGTYGFYKDEKSRRLVLLKSIDSEFCVFHEAGGVEWKIKPDADREIGFEFLPPKPAWYNTTWGAVHVQRVAQRQFQRGITSKNVEVNVLTKGQMAPSRVSFELLSELFEKNVEPAKAMAGLGKGLSVALNGQFAIDPTKQTIRLFKEPIGVWGLDGRKFKFELNEPDLLRTEVSDAVKVMGYTAEVS